MSVVLSEAARQKRNEYAKAWRAKNREKVREYQRNWRRQNPDKVEATIEKYWERKAAEGSGDNGKD